MMQWQIRQLVDQWLWPWWNGSNDSTVRMRDLYQEFMRWKAEKWILEPITRKEFGDALTDLGSPNIKRYPNHADIRPLKRRETMREKPWVPRNA